MTEPIALPEPQSWPAQPWPNQRLTGLQNFAHRLQKNTATQPLARMVELFIRIVFSAAIPSAAQIHRTVHFGHNGLAVVVNKDCVIEEYAFIGSHVVLGGRTPLTGAPYIECYAIIHAGAKVIGPIRIGKGAVIAANAVVNRDVPSRCLAGGIPARVIKSGIDYENYAPVASE